MFIGGFDCAPGGAVLADSTIVELADAGEAVAWLLFLFAIGAAIALGDAGAKLRKMRRGREQTLREVSAYVVEGSVAADHAEQMILALGVSARRLLSWLTVFRLDPKSWLERERTYRDMIANVAEGRLEVESAIPVLRAMAATAHEDAEPAGEQTV